MDYYGSQFGSVEAPNPVGLFLVPFGIEISNKAIGHTASSVFGTYTFQL